MGGTDMETTPGEIVGWTMIFLGLVFMAIGNLFRSMKRSVLWIGGGCVIVGAIVWMVAVSQKNVDKWTRGCQIRENVFQGEVRNHSLRLGAIREKTVSFEISFPVKEVTVNRIQGSLSPGQTIFLAKITVWPELRIAGKPGY